MIVYKDYNTINILGDEIIIISSDTSYGKYFAAEMNNKIHYLDNRMPITSLVKLWQSLNNKVLTDEQLSSIFVNYLQAINMSLGDDYGGKKDD